jgi:hypothetical protein
LSAPNTAMSASVSENRGSSSISAINLHRGFCWSAPVGSSRHRRTMAASMSAPRGARLKGGYDVCSPYHQLLLAWFINSMRRGRIVAPPYCTVRRRLNVFYAGASLPRRRMTRETPALLQRHCAASAGRTLRFFNAYIVYHASM